jgi:tetratricopeptide (TPR) repeat protein
MTFGPAWATAAALFVAAANAQNTPAGATATEKTGEAAKAMVNRAQAYYHLALASIYEDEALTEGRSDEVTKAIEEYKLALNADPNSAELNDALADLYFRIGRVREAESTARSLLKNSPGDATAHKLLGRIYLRQLGEGETAGATATGRGNVLDLAIAEFEKIVSLDPKSVENHMVLGQLYTVKHQPEKAEAEFKIAEGIEPESEDVVLNLARLYAQSGDLQHAVKAIEAVPADGRSPKMELTLGALYDQLKQTKDAITAYRHAVELEPDDPQSREALAQEMLSNEQFDEALKQFEAISEADPDNSEALIHIAEIQRRQGKFEPALETIRKARKNDPKSLEAGYNEGMLLDDLGRLDEAVQTYQEMVDLTSHANGAYKDDEKTNRGIFLERLANLYIEQNKTDLAVATYQKLIEMGGKQATGGYQGQIDAYRENHDFKKSLEVARKAVAASPKDHDLKLLLAGELADQDKPDEGMALAKSLLDGASPDEQRGVWCALAQMNIRLRRWKEAEEALDKAEPLATKDEDRAYVVFLRGTLADRLKHLEPAEQYFQKSLELDPGSALVANYLGYMWADKGIKLPEALKLIRKAVELEPANGAYLDSLGWVYFKMGENELAEDNLRQAVSRTQTDPTVHMHLGDLYEKTGRIRLAVAQWELSLAAFAKSLPADVEPGDVAKVQKKLEGARLRLAKEEQSLAPAKPE